MNSQGYYRVLDGTVNNRAETQLPLVVNCAGQCVMEVPFETIDRRHDNYLMYLYSGELTVWIGDRQEVLHAGQAIVFYSELPYRYQSQTGEPILYYWMHITGTDARTLLQRCGLEDHKPMAIGLQEELILCFQRLFSEFIRREECFDLCAGALATQLCIMVGRLRARSEHRGGERTDRLSASLHYIHRNYCEEISVARLAELEHLSTSQYRAVFRSVTGVSPRGYVTMLRMHRARELIVQTSLPFGEIAEQLGYRDPLYFSRVFRESCGVSPREYRRTPRDGQAENPPAVQ